MSLCFLFIANAEAFHLKGVVTAVYDDRVEFATEEKVYEVYLKRLSRKTVDILRKSANARYKSIMDFYPNAIDIVPSDSMHLQNQGALTYAKIQYLIASRGIRSIEDLLAALPEWYRKHYTFMYQSHSQQEATPEKPRIIIYGPDARLMLAMTGDASMIGGTILEVIEWNAAFSKFNFREVDFSSIQRASTAPVFHNTPQTCAGCYQTPSRPNWDPYNFWRGAYGSLSRGGVDTTEKGSQEHRWYLQFLAQSRDHYRYAFLPPEIKQ